MDQDRNQVAFQTRMGEQVVKMTSTLVETVSINYEDFNESFLTCSTCLCSYDGSEHTPKLLPCSHTVCLHCLGRIASLALPTTSLTSYTTALSSDSAQTTISSSSLTGVTGVTPRETFRCPICRELIHVPRGGVQALPPSFLVNQLLDLMASQRREVIPKCTQHAQELLFCETCNQVFCAVCLPSPHTPSAQTGDHTIIPFSIALKRNSEILLYKANECLAKLTEASEIVSDELCRLNSAAEAAQLIANNAFDEAQARLERLRSQTVSKIREVAGGKKDKLKEQLELIDKERAKVRQTCDGLEYQVEVRHITKRISELSAQLDSFASPDSVRHPRENAYLLCKTESDLMSLEGAVCTNIQTSTTFPPLCTLSLAPDSFQCVGIEMELILETRDYHNHLRKEGGDPVRVGLQTPQTNPQPVITIQDNEDGTYSIRFTPTEVGAHEVHVEIFGKGIRDDNLTFEVSEHNNPVKMWGRGELCQPVSISKNEHGEIFVLDTGNARIVVLDMASTIRRVLNNETLEGRSCTGIVYCNSTDQLLVVNWRTKQVTKISPKDGSTIGKFTHEDFFEPIGISVDGKGNIYIADNGAHCVFIFDPNGNLKSKIKRDNFGLLGGVAIAPDGKTLVVADISLFIINIEDENHQSIKEIKVGGKGRFGGVYIDPDGLIVATRTEKSRSFIQVFKENKIVATIDSFISKLKRPSDVVVANSKNILVVDLGNDCVKQYRYNYFSFFIAITCGKNSRVVRKELQK